MIPVINRFRKVAELIMVRCSKGGFISKRVVAACGVISSGKVSRNIYSGCI